MLLGVLAGCDGTITGPRSVVAGEPGPESTAAPSRAEPTSPLPPADIGATWLRQLTAREYEATAVALFGGVPPGFGSSLPAPLQVASFDNNAEVVGLSDEVLAAYQASAERLALFVTQDAQRLATIFTCSTAAARATCLNDFARVFGRRVFRRPLAQPELAALVAVGQANPTEDVRAIIEAMLLSPSFLFRVEEHADRLEPHELATRLSFLVLGRGPSVELLDRANAGALDTPQGLADEATRLLAQAEANGPIEHFATQWLQVPRVRFAERPEAAYPRWTLAARAAAETEATLLVRSHLEAPGPFLDVLTARYGFVNRDLAAIYETPAPASGFERREWPAGSPRGGVLTLAGTLASTAKLEVTAPITRGLFVRMALMCESFSVPNDIPALPPADGGAVNERERLARHRADPACAACHAKLEPLGFALSRYDAAGVYRPTDSRGAAIDDRGSFSGFDQTDFSGPHELSARLKTSNEVASCAVRHFVRFAMGRLDRPGDERLIERLATEVFREGDGRLQTLVVRFVQTDTFRSRRPPGATE